MKIADVIKQRTPDWHQLELDLSWLRQTSRSKLDPSRVAAFARRYRAVCSDLALAQSQRFPPVTMRYLHQLVAEAHTQFYRSESFQIRRWLASLFTDVPRRILFDPCTWIALFLFWGLFLGSFIAGAIRPEFASEIAGEPTLTQFEAMYAHPMDEASHAETQTLMTGFYLFNNAGIGLKCFAGGIFLGVGSLMVLAFNAIFLGTIFGHMFNSPSSGNFITFVTAHGPFELTAVVLSAAAGLRLGWSILDTGGWSRAESLRRIGPRALEMAGVATILFLLAAYIEGFISPSSFPYGLKFAVALLSTLLMAGYFFGLGYFYRRGISDAPG